MVDEGQPQTISVSLGTETPHCRPWSATLLTKVGNAADEGRQRDKTGCQEGELKGNQARTVGLLLDGDADGIIVIPPQYAAEIAEKAKAYHAGEEDQLDGILTRGEWPRPWVTETLEKVGFEFVD